MTDTSASTHPEPPSVELRQFSGAALAEWGRIVEQVLRAVAHALNNRAAAIALLIDLSHDITPDVSASQSILRSELERVGELTRAVRALTAAGAEGGANDDVTAFSPADLVPDINTILRLYGEHRPTGIEVHALNAVPVRLSCTQLLRACVSVAVAAAEHQARDAVRIEMSGTADGDWLDVHAPATVNGRSTYAAEAAAQMGGGISEGRLGFRVPSLAQLRRRAAR